jgi:hypothetical protein
MVMNKDRIQIDGVWYVKEDNQNDEPIELDVIETQGCLVENTNFCYDATRIANDKGGFYEGVDIQVTDKRSKPWKEDNWDNSNWMRGVLEYNPESWKELPDLGSEDIKFLMAFLQHLKDKEWI